MGIIEGDFWNLFEKNGRLRTSTHGPPKSKPSPSTIDTSQSQSPDSELWTQERVQATWKEEVNRAAREKIEENRKAEEDLERELWNQNVIKDMERLKEKGIKMRLPPQSQSKL